MKSHWLDDRLKGIGKTNSDLAVHLNLPNSRITDIKQNKRKVTLAEAKGIAAFLDMSLEDVADLLDSGSELVA